MQKQFRVFGRTVKRQENFFQVIKADGSLGDSRYVVDDYMRPNILIRTVQSVAEFWAMVKSEFRVAYEKELKRRGKL